MFATIDIGTNSVLLLIGEPLPDGTIRPIQERVWGTRLGEGISRSSRISDTAAERTLDALGVCWELCVRLGVREVAAVGTWALRKATNAADFLLIVRKSLGLDIEVISEEREAHLTWEACAKDFGRDIVVVDVGGGSTEFVTTGREKQRVSIVSVPIGCVSLTERFIKSDPASAGEIERLRRETHKVLKKNLLPSIYARPHDRVFVATGGTATTLAAMRLKLNRYDPVRVHGLRLKIDELRDLIHYIGPKTIEERRELPGLTPERADVILAGAEIIHEAMSCLGYWDVTISDRGVKWGLFYEKFCQQSQQEG